MIPLCQQLDPLPGHFSQCRQDEFVDDVYCGSRGGVFVEIGAGDGLTFSNTAFLERERGWTGLLIEANPAHLEALRANRPNSVCIGCAAGPENGEVGFSQVKGPGNLLSAPSAVFDVDRAKHFFKPEDNDEVLLTTVPQRRAADLFAAHSIIEIDYLSIDVEGYELDVLRGIDWDKIKVGIITVENLRADQELKKFFYKQGFIPCSQLAWDDAYIHYKLADKITDRPIRFTDRGSMVGIHFSKFK